ncbi:hypothetical protein KUV26_21965 [Leisingera daeponensis]|uniref:Uncharacterized protein n=1 Tax=Leisingera daeponensis TaxID=405746 RepID=A0ABS7NLP0_9RHOB|nr:hypothetical protein [Leisingera daeponensis]MBY6142109.1 hypothetical protein [Leisingera daeponensis]
MGSPTIETLEVSEKERAVAAFSRHATYRLIESNGPNRTFAINADAATAPVKGDIRRKYCHGQPK